jgi:hypothetical protein
MPVLATGLKAEWNGERIETSADGYAWHAYLENYDPTPMNAWTNARGPHAAYGEGATEAQAVCDLIEKLVEL